MTLRAYLVPLIGTGSPSDSRRPAYLSDGGVAAGYAAMDYGDDPVMLAVADVTATEHTAIVAHADATAFPVNLDATIGANLATVQAALESHNIPAEWVTAAMTFRFVFRWMCGLFAFKQRFQGLAGGRLFPPGITLDSTVGDLTVNARQTVQNAANALGISTQGITLTTTIRAALKVLGDQLPFPTSIRGLTL